jgi:hypothetical protein
VILHETIHELHFEKDYDIVNWSFLQQAMRMKGFDPKWCDWVQKYIEKGSVGIRVNDDIGHYFQTKKGLRQGDPLSPIIPYIKANQINASHINWSTVDGIIILSFLHWSCDTCVFLFSPVDPLNP